MPPPRIRCSLSAAGNRLEVETVQAAVELGLRGEFFGRYDLSPGRMALSSSAHMPRVAIPDESVLRGNSGRARSISGTNVTPRPSPRETATMIEDLRLDRKSGVEGKRV